MSTPEIDTRAAIERALDEFDIFLAAGVLVWSLPPASLDALSTLQGVTNEFNKLKETILSA